MILLYCLIAAMLLIAVLLLAVPFIKLKSYKTLAVIAPLLGAFSLGLYFLTNNHAAFEDWLAHGKEHYQLLVEYQQMGGLDGIIKRVSAKAKANPTDAQGWYILGKLYLMKQDYPAAKSALKKAHALKPEDGQIEYFYKIAEGRQ